MPGLAPIGGHAIPVASGRRGDTTRSMQTPEDPTQRMIRGELLHRAVALGEELMRLADDLGLSIAGLHICQGVEMMRDEAERLLGPAA